MQYHWAYETYKQQTNINWHTPQLTWTHTVYQPHLRPHMLILCLDGLLFWLWVSIPVLTAAEDDTTVLALNHISVWPVRKRNMTSQNSKYKKKTGLLISHSGIASLPWQEQIITCTCTHCLWNCALHDGNRMTEFSCTVYNVENSSHTQTRHTWPAQSSLTLK